MKIAFRVDASWIIGIGHVMRCLTLAKALEQEGHECLFICRDYPGNILEVIAQQGMQVVSLAFADKAAYQEQGISDIYARWLWVSQTQDAEDTRLALSHFKPDWLIVDHYGLDKGWEQLTRGLAVRHMAIDDLANRSHEVDLLLDQNFYDPLRHRYDALVPPHCQCLLGTEYTLLRPELLALKQQRACLGKHQPHPVQNIILFMGGSDADNVTTKVLLALRSLPHFSQLRIEVVIGIANPFKEEIVRLCALHANVHYHCQPKAYFNLLAGADLAIGAGGTSVWERCCIGLPSWVISVAQNQVEGCKAVAKFGAHIYLGNTSDVTAESLLTAFDHFSSSQYNECIQQGIKLVDGQGTQRVVAAIKAKSMKCV